jgi:hypothetical protein
VADRVDAAVDGQQAARPEAALARPVAEPERSQLRRRHDAVLAPGELSEPAGDGWHKLTLHVIVNLCHPT